MSVNNSSLISPRSLKKAKTVRFSLNYDLKNVFLDVVNEKDRHLYEEFICKIRDLGQEICDDELSQILREARGCISILDRNLLLFVQVILLLRWADRSREVVSEYQGFLLDLCSAHTYYAKNIIDHLVNYFKSGKYEEGVALEVEQFNNIHTVIETVLKVIPMTREVLVRSIDTNCPYIKRPYNEHASFNSNVLKIVQYAPSLRYDILKIVTQKMISIDVACDSEAMTNTLDHCMNVYFNFIKETCLNGDGVDFEAIKLLYGDLVRVFESCLISTHCTSYVQFVIFYLLSLKPVLSVGFLQLLWSKVCNPNVAPVIRQAGVSYISSLCSRGGYIPVGLVKDMLTEMSNFVHSYIMSQESITAVYDTRIHGVFYTVCQGIFYIIAFRHKELVNCRKGLQFLNGLNLSKMVQCRLNPLKVCQPVIARNFANVTRAYQLAYCYSILERNSRCTLPRLSRDCDQTIISEYLEPFFPFDPYTLPTSKKFIQPIYREYQDFTDIEESPMVQDEEDDFLEHASPKLTNFIYGNHPGFLHIT